MRHLRNPFVQVGLWTFAITAVVGVVVWTLPWEPEQASSQAGPIDTLYDVLALVSAFFLALVTSILIVAVIHFRKRSPDDLRDGDPIHGNTRLEVIWTTIPALLMVGTAVYSGLVLANIEESKADTQHRQRDRRAVRVDLRIPAGEGSRGRAAPGGGHALPVQARREGRDPLVLGARVPDEAGRRARHDDHRARHADAQGPVHARLHGALRAGPLDDAGDGGGGGPGGIRPLGAAPEERRGAAAGRGGLHSRTPDHRRPPRWPPWRLLQPGAPAPADGAGMDQGGLDDARRRRIRVRPRRRRTGGPGVRADHQGRPDRDGDPARRSARLPGRDRRLRLLGPVDDRPADPARGPLGPRRPQLEGLLPGQHRPQGDRHPVRGHRAVLHVRGRRPGRGGPGRTGAAGPAGGGPEHLQRPVLGPRLADDLPGRDPDLRGARELRAPADDRSARTWRSRA